MAGVELRRVSKTYGAQAVIRDLDLSIEPGEFMVFVGPSGCGKSTTLRMIAGLETLSAGELYIGGQRADTRRPAERGTAMVFQSYALYPHMTVAENMGFALKTAGVPRNQREQQVKQAADSLKISNLLDRFPKDLSGGQRQRVAIGRAIVRQPQVFLFDEPLSNLDAALRVDMRIELMRLHARLGATMIYVTHDQTEAMTMGHRIAVFNGGKIEQLGAPMALYNAPANLFVASFLGAPKINLIPRPEHVDGSAHAMLWQRFASHPKFDQAVTFGLRPDDVQVDRLESGVPATVELVEHLGDVAVVYARVAGLPELLTAKLRQDQASLHVGQMVGLVPDVSRAHGFDRRGLRVVG